MKTEVFCFDVKDYEAAYLLEAASTHNLSLKTTHARLDVQTARLAKGYKVISAFVNDDLSRPVLEVLKSKGVELIAMRCAGFNNIDGEALKDLGLQACRVPEYSPQSVAEFALVLLMNLTRKVHKSYARTREMNFTLNGLVGFDLRRKKIGIIGTGKMGKKFCELLAGFDAELIAYDVCRDEQWAVRHQVSYVDLDKLFFDSDIILLHVPLTKSTYHMINAETIDQMKPGVLIVNTSRGGLVETHSLIAGLKSKKIGAAALDVYEEEAEFFFQDFSEQILDDDTLARLMTFPNVIVTSHQGYLTENALKEIADTTCHQTNQFFQGQPIQHPL